VKLRIDEKEAAKVEYEQAHEMWRLYTQLRRRDLMLFTAFQGAIITLAGENILNMTGKDYALAILAMFISIIGVNNERRLACYMWGYRDRGKEIEEESGMSLLSIAEKRAKRDWSIPNRYFFPAYYFIFALLWIAGFMYNILR